MNTNQHSQYFACMRFAVPFTASSPSLSPISTYFLFFFLFAPLFALCALEWSPCTGMASWGELVKHLLQPLQFCVILASTEPLMLGL